MPVPKVRLAEAFAVAAVALMLLRPAHAATPEFTGLATISAAAEQAVRGAAGVAAAQLVVSAEALDPRLRMPLCPVPLRSSIAGDGQLRDHTTVGLRCESATRWSLYVSVAVASELPVLVAQRALARDSALLAEDFRPVVRRLPGLASNYVRDASELAGRRLGRAISLGEALPADALQLAPVVHRGQQLTLVAHASGMDVRVQVVAMADGRPQERIRVQNLGSQRIIEATVRSAELVEVSL